jgi:hypothetical protein
MTSSNANDGENGILSAPMLAGIALSAEAGVIAIAGGCPIWNLNFRSAIVGVFETTGFNGAGGAITFGSTTSFTGSTGAMLTFSERLIATVAGLATSF